MSNKNVKVLYHYTSRIQAELIMKKGYLKLTPSNLIKPTDPKLIRDEDGVLSWVSEISDAVKPVVWLTDSKDPSVHGLDKLKEDVRITVPMKDSYKWWVTWAERNRMNKKWFRDLTKGLKYGSWYVSEEIISLEDVLLIEDLKTGEIILDNRQTDVISA